MKNVITYWTSAADCRQSVSCSWADVFSRASHSKSGAFTFCRLLWDPMTRCPAGRRHAFPTRGRLCQKEPSVRFLSSSHERGKPHGGRQIRVSCQVKRDKCGKCIFPISSLFITAITSCCLLFCDAFIRQSCVCVCVKTSSRSSY